jgi:hypothetical protein
MRFAYRIRSAGLPAGCSVDLPVHAHSTPSVEQLEETGNRQKFRTKYSEEQPPFWQEVTLIIRHRHNLLS